MLIHDCIPCQYGDHDNHRRIVEAAPEGMLGGVQCHREGECRERAAREPVVDLGPLLENQALTEMLRELDENFRERD